MDRGKFTEKLLVEKMNINSDKAKDILTKLKEFNLICCSKELVDDDFLSRNERNKTKIHGFGVSQPTLAIK